jgi:PAS domain S-box-containing protein
MTVAVRKPAGDVALDRLPLVTYVAPFDAPWSVDYVSPQIEALLGFAVEAWVSDPEFWLGRVVAEDRARFVATCNAVCASSEPMSMEYRMLAHDGREVWVRDVGTVVRDEDGNATLQGFLTDITREKELELELARERAQTDAFFRDSSVGMAITDAEGRYLRVNEALARMHCVPAEQHLGRRLREVNPLLADHVEPLIDEVRSTGRPLQGGEVNIEVRPGTTVSALVSYFPVDAAGEQHYGGIVVDVTDLHRALDERAETERSARELIEQLPLVTYVNALEPDVHVTYISPQVEEIFGYAPSEWLADRGLWGRVVHPDDLDRVRKQHADARAGGGQVECEYRIVQPDGSIRWALDRLHTARSESGNALFEQGFVIDITARKRAEQAEHDAVDALRGSEEQFRSLFDGALDAMLIVDDEGRHIDANPAACRLFGHARDELLSLSPTELSAVVDGRNAYLRDLLLHGMVAGETTIIRPDGSRRELEFSATANVLPGRHLSILRDVTERKQLEQALWQAQKLESVGTLAAGVAHDFNNMLTAISGYTQLLLARLAPGTVEHEHAEEIERASARAARLTSQLLAFGGRQVLQPRAVDLNALVTELTPMLSALAGADVSLVAEPDTELRPARVDAAQMQQVIANLVQNAAAAMPTGGRVVIRTRNVDVERDIEASDGATARELAGGRYVELSITDTGVGMDTETLARAFEPFFTTREVGQGEGLGLSTAYGIVKQSGGTIVGESRPRAGATFHVYLPAAS